MDTVVQDVGDSTEMTLIAAVTDTARWLVGSRILGVRKSQLLWAKAHRRLRNTDFELRTGTGSVFFAADTVAVDHATFNEIFLLQYYATDFRDAAVVDLGAHKGYFGAYTLCSGAASVLSYEPERQNFAYLERAAETFRRRGVDWRVHRAAVGSLAHSVDLQVSRDSWAHSLVGLPDDQPVEVQRIDMVSTQAILQESQSMPGARVVVKVDIEGAECDAICATPVRCWDNVDEMWVEVHSVAPCSSREIVEHLSAAGLELRSKEDLYPGFELLRLKRARNPPGSR